MANNTTVFSVWLQEGEQICATNNGNALGGYIRVWIGCGKDITQLALTCRAHVLFLKPYCWCCKQCWDFKGWFSNALDSYRSPTSASSEPTRAKPVTGRRLCSSPRPQIRSRSGSLHSGNGLANDVAGCSAIGISMMHTFVRSRCLETPRSHRTHHRLVARIGCMRLGEIREHALRKRYARLCQRCVSSLRGACGLSSLRVHPQATVATLM